MKTYTDPIPMDEYLKNLNQALSDAYWNGESDELQRLQVQIKTVNELIERGERYHVPF
jgi:hypothetical protein